MCAVPPIGAENTFVPELVDNPHSVLDVADLVFVDPAETGFTRVLPAGKRADFYSVEGDAQSIADFIFAWLKVNQRENSPRYILGVTYPMSEFRELAPDSEGWYYGPPNRFSGNDWPGMLRDHLKANPAVRYLSMNGLHDGIATVGSVRYLFSRTRLPRDRVIEREYVGGHSAYTVEETRQAEPAEIRAFVVKPQVGLRQSHGIQAPGHAGGTGKS